MGTGHQHPPRGLDLGYARVCTTNQGLERQLDALATAGLCTDRIDNDKRTGTTVARLGLAALVDCACEGDTMVVHTHHRQDRHPENLTAPLLRRRPDMTVGEPAMMVHT